MAWYGYICVLVPAREPLDEDLMLTLEQVNVFELQAFQAGLYGGKDVLEKREHIR